MHTIYVDPVKNEEFLRNELYDGQLVVYSARKAMQAVIDHAAGMLNEAFTPFDPLYAQFEMPVEEWVAIFAALKPRFIHHPETMRLLVGVIKELGWDLDQWYVDVPRLRGVTSHGYLTTGVGYAHHPHRDNWWSAPMQQINFWLPIYEYEGSSGMEFYPDYWGVEVPNSSNEFDYYDWNAHGRADAAKMIKSDTRKQPKATISLDLKNKLRLVVPVGGLKFLPPATCMARLAMIPEKPDFRSTGAWSISPTLNPEGRLTILIVMVSVHHCVIFGVPATLHQCLMKLLQNTISAMGLMLTG
jgi:hypothetical protein